MNDSLNIEEITDLDNENERFFFKVVVVGDTAVGKSNILTRYVQNEFNSDSKSTVGVELSTKLYKIKDQSIKVHLWDTAGQERYQSITAAYYKGAKGAIIVYDITRRSTFDNVNRWYNEIISLSDKNIVIVLAGNKADLEESREVQYSEALKKAEQLGKKILI